MNHPRARNDALLEALREARLTYEQLATDVRAIAAESGDSLRTNRSAVAHWVAGRTIEPRTASFVAEALSRRLGRQLQPHDLELAAPETAQSQSALGAHLGPDPVDTLRRIGEADIQRRKLLTGAAYSVVAAALPLGLDQALAYRARAAGGTRAGRAELDALRDMTSVFTALDERHGGQHGRSAVVQYLRSDVADLCRATFATEDEHREALSLAANLVYLCGWKAYDANEHGLAQRYYLQGLALTREADNDLHTAWMMRIMAHNGMDLRRPQHTLNLAEAALDRVRGRVSPVTESLFAVTRARALATADRGPEATAQIRRAQDLALTGDPADMPFWAALWGAPRATVASHTGKTFEALGDHAHAEKHYADSTRARPNGGHQRITALDLAAQGRAQAAQGHLEAACSTWSRSLDMFGGVRSSRATKQISSIRRLLRVFDQRGVQAARDLDERARSWQAAHA
ncbi:hypothetical protein [Streptomyces graminilatus]|uniref:hypothetical protein n=1 Tax=Streptomyces graminilatus TaxID=1464070 RepID=UPI0006E389F4|nr:hypothetical protein [Streptomyces graminilatus]